MEYIYDPVTVAAELKEMLEGGREPISGAAQHPDDLYAWQKFFFHFKVKSIIELGTGSGAFSLWLKSYVPNFLTYDNKEPYHDIPEFINIDILGDPYFIASEIELAERPFLLYCDNGDKPREVKTYYKFLRPGDYLATHDYHIEIQPSDIPAELELLLTSGLTAFFRKDYASRPI